MLLLAAAVLYSVIRIVLLLAGRVRAGKHPAVMTRAVVVSKRSGYSATGVFIGRGRESARGHMVPGYYIEVEFEDGARAEYAVDAADYGAVSEGRKAQICTRKGKFCGIKPA